MSEESEKIQIDHLRTNTYHLVKKIVTICSVDPEIIGLKEIIKKAKINASKTYSSPGKFARRAK